MTWAESVVYKLQLASLAGIFMCPGFIIWMMPDLARQHASKNWPSVQGEIKMVRVLPIGSAKDGTSYAANPIFKYTVDGQEYTSGKVDLGPDHKYSSEFAAYHALQQYEPGMAVTVFYDPTDPYNATLQTGICPLHFNLVLGLAIATVVCVIGSIFTLRSWLGSWFMAKPANEDARFGDDVTT